MTQAYEPGWDPDPPPAPVEVEPGADRHYLRLQAQLVDATKLDDLPQPTALVSQVLMEDSIAWLHGKPGHGKSFVALDLACSVATGRPWRGEHAVTAGVVLYVVAEGATGMTQRVRAWEAYNETTVAAGVLQFLPVAVQMLRSDDVAGLAQLVAQLQPVLVVIDTQARVTVGADENSSNDMGRFVAAVERLRASSGACVLTVHHESRGGDTLRGSTALEGAATTVMRVAKDGSLLRIDCTKQKDAPPFEPLLARLEPVVTGGRSSAVSVPNHVGLHAVTTGTQDSIRDALRDAYGTTGAPASVLMDDLGLSKSTFYRAMNPLLSRGEVVNAGSTHRTLYVLAGQEPLP